MVKKKLKLVILYIAYLSRTFVRSHIKGFNIIRPGDEAMAAATGKKKHFITNRTKFSTQNKIYRPLLTTNYGSRRQN